MNEKPCSGPFAHCILVEVHYMALSPDLDYRFRTMTILLSHRLICIFVTEQ
jgi:hypothetical protein